MTDIHSAPDGEFMLFRGDDGQFRLKCRLESEPRWLPPAAKAGLYGKDTRTINKHLDNIYEKSGLAQNATVRKFRVVHQEDNRQISRVIGYAQHLVLSSASGPAGCYKSIC